MDSFYALMLQEKAYLDRLSVALQREDALLARGHFYHLDRYPYFKGAWRGTRWNTSVSPEEEEEISAELDRRKSLRGVTKALTKNQALLSRHMEKYCPLREEPVPPPRTSVSGQPGERLPTDGGAHHPESLTHRSLRGDLVRSKSEAIICDRLFSYNLPFQYEKSLELGQQTYLPDFTIHSPRAAIYWEHFGMTSSSEYRAGMYRKLENYHRHGILLWENLLITCDHLDGGLDIQLIDGLIRLFILPRFQERP